MKPSTREWIKKAESDYQAALALARRREISAGGVTQTNRQFPKAL
jgi:hypothetical protein